MGFPRACGWGCFDHVATKPFGSMDDCRALLLEGEGECFFQWAGDDWIKWQQKNSGCVDRMSCAISRCGEMLGSNGSKKKVDAWIGCRVQSLDVERCWDQMAATPVDAWIGCRVQSLDVERCWDQMAAKPVDAWIGCRVQSLDVERCWDQMAAKPVDAWIGCRV